MGIDRDVVYRGQCLCGHGEIVIIFCSPDHPWPTRSISFEPAILCQHCRSRYELIEQNSKYVIVKKHEVANRNTIFEEYKQRYDSLLKLPQTSMALEQFGEFLEAQPSVAARYRVLKDAGLVHETYNTFRKHWANPKDWMRNHIRANNLVTVLKILGKNEPNISAEVEELEQLFARYSVPLPIVGKPLLDTFSYRYR